VETNPVFTPGLLPQGMVRVRHGRTPFEKRDNDNGVEESFPGAAQSAVRHVSSRKISDTPALPRQVHADSSK